MRFTVWHATLNAHHFQPTLNGALRLRKLSFGSLSKVKPEDIYNLAGQNSVGLSLIRHGKDCKASVSKRSIDWRQSDL